MKKKICLFIGLLLPTINFLLAQNLVPFKADNGKWGYKDQQFDDIVITPNYDYATDFSEGLAVVANFSLTKLHRFGFIDKTGKEIIPLKYSSADKFSEGLAPVKNELGKIVFIDKTGKEVIKTIYTEARSFSNGLAAVLLNKKMGFIDKNGTVVIPIIYEAVKDFEDDCTLAMIDGITVQIDKTGKELPMINEYGYVDRIQKKIIITPSNFNIGTGFAADGLAIVSSHKNGYSGLINKNGALIVPIKYNEIKRLNNGLYAISENGKVGIVDKMGHTVIYPKYKNIFSLTNKLSFAVTASNEYIIIDKLGVETTPPLTDFWNFEGGSARVKKQDKYGTINEEGKLIVPIIYSSVFTNEKGTIAVELNKMQGLINNDGSIIAQPIYQSVNHFSAGMARVQKNNKYGFIDKTGKEVIPTKYDLVYSFYEDLCIAKETYNWGIINKAGKWVVQPKYSYINEISEDLAVVSLNNKYGYIDKTGKEILPLQYGKASSFINGIAVVQQFGKYGFINKKGQYIFKNKFDDANNFVDNYATVKTNDVWGCIDKTGSYILQPQYEDVRNVSENKLAVKEKAKWGYVNLKGETIVNHDYSSVKDFSEGLAAVSYYDLGGYFYIDSTGKRIIEGPFRLADEFNNGIAHVVTQNLQHEYINKKGEKQIKYTKNVQGENLRVTFKYTSNNNNNNSTNKIPKVTPADKKLNYSFTKYYAYSRVSSYSNAVESNYKVVVSRDFIQVYIEGNRGLYSLWNEYKIVASDEMKEPGQAADLAYLSSNNKMLIFIRKEGRDVLRIGTIEMDSYTEYISEKN